MKRSLIALSLTALLLGGCALEELTEGDQEAVTVDLQQSDATPVPSDLADVIEDVLPSIVNVRIEQGEGSGQGSGVIIDPDGVILTNAHVIRDATEVEVAFTDGRDSVQGRVLGFVDEKDLAIIKVEISGLEAIELGRSSDMRLGEDVVALGFPLGLGGPTVTKGIVSALDRDVTVQGELGPVELKDLTQTDAAINPGNSGGALIDLSGRLLGINTAAAQAGAAENVGFAIPIDDALPVIEEILEDPIVLGVGLVPLDEQVAVEIGVDPDLVGVVIGEIFPNSAAEEAGLEIGDVITSVAGQPVTTPQDLTDILDTLEEGDIFEVELESSEGSRTVEVEL